MVDVALFELEGVLFDTRELRRDSLHDALQAHGIDPSDLWTTDALPPRAAAADLFRNSALAADDVLLDLIARRAEHGFSFRLATHGAALQAGSGEFIDGAVTHARLAAVTRASRSDANTMLRLSGLENAFTMVVTADDVLDVKPAAAAYHVALERLASQRAVSLESVLALEDGMAGIRAARAAGVRCAAVGAMPVHVAMEADAYVDGLQGQSLRTLDRLSSQRQERER